VPALGGLPPPGTAKGLRMLQKVMDIVLDTLKQYFYIDVKSRDAALVLKLLQALH